MSDDSLNSAKTMAGEPTARIGRFRVGDVILGRYTVTGELGQGGMGIVYKCLDTIGGIEVALKALPPELSHNTLEMEDIRDNFQLVSRLSHPNIASIRTLERDAATGDYYLMMECVRGENLRAWIKRVRKESGAVSLEQALPVLRQAAAALDYAHEEKIVHRDIKPGNIMVTQNGTAKVLDFGLAAEIHTSMSRVSMAYRGTSGTGPYMAPEQWRGRQQGAAADQYALAVTAYEMLAGKLPFESADPVVLKQAVLDETPEVISGLPRSAMTAILRAMAKEPSERFASCADFVAALGGEKAHAKTPRRKGRKAVGYWVLGVCAVVFLAFVARVSCQSDQSYQSDRSDRVQVALQDAATRAKVAELERVVDAALSSGDLKEAGATLAELEQVPGSAASGAKLRTRYELLAGERETNKRYADASMAHDRAKKLDSGQKFGLAQETLERKWLEAEAARQGKSWGQALSGYDAVIAHSADLVKLDVSREDAKTRRLAAEQAKDEAVRVEAATNVKDLFAEGRRAAARAAESFEKGDFSAAEKTWGDAAAEYTKAKSRSLAVQAYDKAKADYVRAVASDLKLFKEHGGKLWNEVDRQVRLGEASANDPTAGADVYRKALLGLPDAVAEAKTAEKAEADRLATERKAAAEKALQEEIVVVLAAARKAKDTGNWQACLDKASEVLELDSGNAEAKRLKSEAESSLTPSLTVTTEAKGKEVAADISDGQQTYTTPHTFTLKPGDKYSFAMSMKSNNLGQAILSKSYLPTNLVITADWCGPRAERVVLEEVQEAVLGQHWTITDLGMTLMPVAAGSFRMGSENGDSDEKPVRTVQLTQDFWMGKTEVTQAEYRQVTGLSPSRFEGDDFPVEQVSWNDAVAFCEELTKRERAAGRLPNGYVYRLPTEAEWEYAARGGAKSEGLTFSGGNNLEDVAWYGDNSGDRKIDSLKLWTDNRAEYNQALLKNECKTHSVGQKQKNELGLYDMSGNVCEWCLDWYQGSYDGLSDVDPKGSPDGFGRMGRGGSWGGVAFYCHVAYRYDFTPTNAYGDLGFRVVLAAPIQ